jgi:pectinesterase
MISRTLLLLAGLTMGPGIAGGLKAQPGPKADAVVALDGSGQFTSIQDAISAAPMRTAATDPRWVIDVRPGIYRERLYVQRERGNILLRGDDAVRTVITSNLHAGLLGPDGKPIGTFRTPTVQIDGDGFAAANLTFENSAGPVGQALALRVDGDRVVFRQCRFLGWQDTVLVNRGRQVFWDCYIEGDVDFVFGGATAFFDHCVIHCLRDGWITAPSTPQGAAHGLVFADCRITGAEGAKAYLGRPWRNYAQAVFLRTEMASVIRPEGWHDWKKTEAHGTVFFAEFAGTGPGAESRARVPWARQLTAAEAGAFTMDRVIGGNDRWNPTAGFAAAAIDSDGPAKGVRAAHPESAQTSVAPPVR